MQTFLVAFIALILLANANIASADSLGPRAFTETVAAAARTAMPTATVAVTGDLELQIDYGSGRRTATLSLANAYDLYLTDPQGLKEVIRIYVEGIAPPVRNTTTNNPVDRSRIIPVVKNRQWFDRV